MMLLAVRLLDPQGFTCQLAIPHGDDAIDVPRNARVMADDDHGDSPDLYSDHAIDHKWSVRWQYPVRRLVHPLTTTWVIRQGNGNRNTLLLAAGEFLQAMISAFMQANQFEELQRALESICRPARIE